MNLYRTLQKDRTAQYIVGTNPTSPLLLDSGTAGGWTTLSVVSYVPTATASMIFVGLVVAGDDPVYVAVAPNTSYSTSKLPGGSAPPLNLGTTGSASSISGAISTWMMLESTNIYWVSADSGGGVFCFGWQDNL